MFILDGMVVTSHVSVRLLVSSKLSLKLLSIVLLVEMVRHISAASLHLIHLLSRGVKVVLLMLLLYSIRGEVGVLPIPSKFGLLTILHIYTMSRHVLTILKRITWSILLIIAAECIWIGESGISKKVLLFHLNAHIIHWRIIILGIVPLIRIIREPLLLEWVAHLIQIGIILLIGWMLNYRIKRPSSWMLLCIVLILRLSLLEIILLTNLAVPPTEFSFFLFLFFDYVV